MHRDPGIQGDRVNSESLRNPSEGEVESEKDNHRDSDNGSAPVRPVFADQLRSDSSGSTDRRGEAGDDETQDKHPFLQQANPGLGQQQSLERGVQALRVDYFGGVTGG